MSMNSTVFSDLRASDVVVGTRACTLGAACVWLGCMVAGCWDQGWGDPRRGDDRSAESKPSRTEPASAPVASLAHHEEVVDGGLDGSVVAPVDVGTDARRATRRSATTRAGTLFDPAHDAAELERLAHEEIVGVERGRGGRSVAFRITFADGSRGYFKPEQTFSGTHWYAEIAAFHLDRLLGTNRVAPSTGRVVPWASLAPALEGDDHADEVVVADDGAVRGVMIAWIEERLLPIDPPAQWDRDLRLGAWEGPYPFVAPGPLRRAIAEQAQREPLDGGDGGTVDAGLEDAPLDGEVAEVEGWDRESRAAELSSLIVFDFLTHNADRWGGGFTNVRIRGEAGPLIYLDNAAGFSRRRARLSTLDTRLEFVQRFERALVRRVRRLDVGELRERLASDPLAPVLDDEQLEHLEQRRVAVIAHVDALVTEHGEERVLAW